MTTTTITKNPTWWTNENNSAWERTKAAVERDWDQTKHDLGGKEPQTKQNVTNTVRQASGKESIPPRGEPAYASVEPAHRFGYGARANYKSQHPEWDNNVERELKTEWQELHPDRKNDWNDDVKNIRYGWDYK